ncbi:DsbA family oxidoreductase [Catenuloplanes atrovinosus]|uniref:DsbA family dithiol-disulfide isomerase n=1 Tax=Catenuloplanes atrovinosus TaxID=137266 RepID=A0AAE3YNS8_9ACTN|nr:DsbA family oxidoreductase [Catenuloplanes atrovinosus]MDR7275484.1 putative DsbA family dithiol-disulfide isomerase [Catenuloplanes atrovinosus]
MTTGIFGPAAEPIVIDVWSDVVCPFCYLGHATLEQAVAQSPHGSAVEIRYHSFLLHPGVGTPILADDYLLSALGMPKAQLDASHAQIAARGARLGLDYRFETALMADTMDAHRIIHLANAHGRQIEAVTRLFRAEFTEGLDVSDHDVLTGLAVELGLDRDEAIKTLTTGGYEQEIRADLAQARQYGITGVPFFVFDGKRAVSGAQPLEMFLRALDVSRQDRAAAPA